MSGTEIAALISVAGNLILGVFGYWQRARKQDAEAKLGTVAEALAYIEAAINANKSLLDSTGAGDKIAATITSYGDAAKTSVDVARMLARAVMAQIKQAQMDAYAASIIAREQAARLVREAELAKQDLQAADVTPQ